MKNIVILGSTGSIGRSTLEVLSKFPDRFRVIGLTTNTSVDRLLEQVKTFRPPYVAVSDPVAYDKVSTALKGSNTKVLSGQEGIIEIACLEEAHTVVAAIVGFAGLVPTYKALLAEKVIALANKEVLVSAGDIFMKTVAQKKLPLIPVDSEHSALFQCIQGQDKASLTRVFLTASGGPFYGMKKQELQSVTVEQALRHPNWSMGKKITIDSATLMNKGFEIIEAHHLFGLPADRIEALIHRQSIVHCIAAFRDGSYIAQMSRPDMKGPIAYALSYPERFEGVMAEIDLLSLQSLTFERPDTEAFPCLALAYEALKAGRTMPAVLNAANEVSVWAFLNNKIGFLQIPVIIEKVMNAHDNFDAHNIEAVVEADRWARQKALEVIKS